MKIINTGLRSITHEEGILEAGKEGEVSPSLAEKLLTLFEGELVAVKEEVKKAVAFVEAVIEPEVTETLAEVPNEEVLVEEEPVKEEVEKHKNGK